MIIVAVLFMGLSACGYQVKDIGKTSVSMVSDIHRHAMAEHIETFMVKLYKRNPRELDKQLNPVIEAQINRLKAMLVKDQPLIIDGKEDVAIMNEAFDPSFRGDRVFQLIAGLASMVHKSYGYHNEFYFLDGLDQQKLYNSARNLEVLSWRLRNSKSPGGEPLLLSVATNGPVINLSFERLLGKMISIQDSMALVAADGNARAINSVAHSILSMVFIPI